MKRIQIASLGKRILSSLIDLALISGLTCLFYFTCFRQVVSNVNNFNYLYMKIDEERFNSNLYIKDGSKIITILDKDSSAGEKDISIPLKTFYVGYYPLKDIEDKTYWYFTHILYLDDYLKKYSDITKPEVVLLEWNSNHSGYVHKDTSKQEDVNEFFRVSYSTAVSRLNSVDPIKGYSDKIAFSNIRAVMYSTMLGTFIPCLLIPIILKNGKTIGKLATNLIVLTDEGYYYKRYKLIFRYLAFYFVEVFGGVVTIGLTFILSSSLVLFSKKKRALHDYIAFSVVADGKNSVFFLNKKEEDECKEKLKLSENS